MTQLNWPISAPPLTDGEVQLCGWDLKDAEVVDTAGQKSEIQRWTMVPSPYEPEHAADFVGERSLSRWKEGSGASFAIASEGGDKPPRCLWSRSGRPLQPGGSCRLLGGALGKR